MVLLDQYSSEQLEAGFADLSYHLANPQLDSIIWSSQERWPEKTLADPNAPSAARKVN